METKTCKCGKSSVSFEVVGEDLYSAELNNCTKKKNKKEGEVQYICKECGDVVETADYYMMVDWD